MCLNTCNLFGKSVVGSSCSALVLSSNSCVGNIARDICDFIVDR